MDVLSYHRSIVFQKACFYKFVYDYTPSSDIRFFCFFYRNGSLVSEEWTNLYWNQCFCYAGTVYSLYITSVLNTKCDHVQ